MKCLLLIYTTEADRQHCLANNRPDESIKLAGIFETSTLYPFKHWVVEGGSLRG
jgi:hypothetical protein